MALGEQRGLLRMLDDNRNPFGEHRQRSAFWRTEAAVDLLADSNSSERTAAVGLLAEGEGQATVDLSADSGESRRTATVRRWQLSTDGGRRRLASRRTAEVRQQSASQRTAADLGGRGRSDSGGYRRTVAAINGQWRLSTDGGGWTLGGRRRSR